ncbi:hypothetical protein AB0B45_19495 [Nonomuraea sp. NPDC049152]
MRHLRFRRHLASQAPMASGAGAATLPPKPAAVLALALALGKLS